MCSQALFDQFNHRYMTLLPASKAVISGESISLCVALLSSTINLTLLARSGMKKRLTPEPKRKLTGFCPVTYSYDSGKMCDVADRLSCIIVLNFLERRVIFD